MTAGRSLKGSGLVISGIGLQPSAAPPSERRANAEFTD
jgi:hypothetical protein